jgi:polyhydroxyalkanoate synthesis regulator phasin
MTENSRQVLDMLSKGQITADEAERLLAALDKNAPGPSADSPQSKAKPKFLRVVVDSENGFHGPATANIRVPMQLLRAGVKLASLLPAQARDHVNDAFRENGLPFDLSQIKPENLEEIIDQLDDLTVDVDQKHKKVKVRVFCE